MYCRLHYTYMLKDIIDYRFYICKSISYWNLTWNAALKTGQLKGMERMIDPLKEPIIRLGPPLIGIGHIYRIQTYLKKLMI